MKRFTFIVLALLLIPGLAFAMPGPSPKTLVWDANTETDLAGYKIYWGANEGAFNDADSIDVGNVTEYDADTIPGPKVAITAYDTSQNESEFSNTVNLDNTAPDSNSTLRTENR
jgi:hypothetical protein